MSISVEVETVTSKQAKNVLEKHNKRNRKIRDRTVRQYANDMTAGKWLLAGDPLRFDVDQNLIDGQHRLSALVMSGVPKLQMVVMRGLDPEVQDVIDTGARRTAGNMLELRGHVKNATVVASVARVGISMEKGMLVTSRSRITDNTHSDVIDWVDRNYEGLAMIIPLAAAIYRGTGKGSVSSLTYALHTLYRLDNEKGIAFIKDLIEMRTEGRGDPRAALLRFLRNLSEMPRDRTTGARTLYGVHTAWNAHVAGEQIVTITDGIHGKPLPVLKK